VIGYKNKLPWHIRSDLKRFKRLTIGHAIIMGRSTFNSIGRPLADRTNIVMTRSGPLSNTSSIRYQGGTQLCWVRTLEEALFKADIITICRHKDELFIIGGEEMYSLFDELVNRIYLTEVFGEFTGDAYFAKTFVSRQWKILVEEDYTKNYTGDEFPYRFSILERRDRKHRYEFVSKFFTEQLEKTEWLRRQVKSHTREIDEYIQHHLEL
jgi:dihydrofolate reductase